MYSLDIIGWIGSLCLATCAFPQAYKAIIEKNSNGVSIGMIILWWIGEICAFIYILPKMDYPLLVNYIVNIIAVSIIAWYKFFPSNE